MEEDILNYLPTVIFRGTRFKMWSACNYDLYETIVYFIIHTNFILNDQ